jgi:hypothetical protein
LPFADQLEKAIRAKVLGGAVEAAEAEAKPVLERKRAGQTPEGRESLGLGRRAGRQPSALFQRVPLNEFLDHLRVERKLAKNTVLAYGADLRPYLSYLEERNVSLGDVGSRGPYRIFLGPARGAA